MIFDLPVLQLVAGAVHNLQLLFRFWILVLVVGIDAVLHWLVIDVLALLVFLPSLCQFVTFVLLAQLTCKFLAPF